MSDKKTLFSRLRRLPLWGVFLFLMMTLLYACQPQVVEVEKIVEVEVTREVEVEVEAEFEPEAIATESTQFGSQPVDALGSEEGDGSPFEPDAKQKGSVTNGSDTRSGEISADLPSDRCVTFLSSDLTVDSVNGIPLGRLQLAIWYDGDIDPSAPPALALELIDPVDNATIWLEIGGQADIVGDITPYTQLVTREYALAECRLTGRFVISGVMRDGYPDGLGFGLFEHRLDGQTRMLKSHADLSDGQAIYAGVWPATHTELSFADISPQLSHALARQQAQAMIYGAQILGDGSYEIQ